MRDLHIGNGSVTVSFDVCSAMFDYAVALANAGRTDRIQVPVLAGGEPGFSNILVGPATQLYCTASAEPEIDLDDQSIVLEIRRRITAATESDAPQAFAVDPETVYDDAAGVDY